ncbi:MAG: hypothetical protein ACLPYY_01600 [Acidimicrobiales bacterium]
MYRATAGVVAVLCTLAFAVGLSAPAGAAASRTGSAFGPHDPGVSAHGTQTPAVQLPHAVAPLTQANFVVTDLASGNATVYEWSSVTPTYNTNSNCNMSKAAGLCLSYGSGPGPDGGAVALAPQSSSWTAGTLYPSIGGPSSVSVAGQNCNNVGSAAEAVVSSDLELDQYVFTSGSSPIQSIALQIDCTTATTDISGTIAYNIVPTNPSSGYYIYGQQGEITGFGNDNYLVYLDGAQYYNLNAPIVGMAATPDGGGYWMVGSDGGVYASGDAGFYGSTGSLHLNKPVVGMAATPDGKGYWFVASDGGIFAYGDAGFYGSTGSLHLNKPVVGMAATPDGKGYWFVASDGGFFAYGDAGFYGSTGSIHLNEPIVGMASTPDGHGYWFAASDGGVFNYGDAPFDGSLGGTGVTDAAGMSLGI